MDQTTPKIIYETFREVADEIAKHPNTKERPFFGDEQVRAVQELVVGHRYRLHKNEGVVVDVTYKGKARDPILDDVYTLRFVADDGYVWAQFAEDCGLLPYEDGRWNSTNWVEKIRHARKPKSKRRTNKGDAREDQNRP